MPSTEAIPKKLGGLRLFPSIQEKLRIEAPSLQRHSSVEESTNNEEILQHFAAFVADVFRTFIRPNKA